MALSIVTLNTEGNTHLGRVFPFLKRLEADVICLQEVFQHSVTLIRNHLNISGPAYYVPVRRIHEMNGVVEDQTRGNLLLTTKEITDYSVHTYFRDREVLNADYSVQIATINDGAEEYRIMNTQFAWSPNGNVTTDQQRTALYNLLEKIGGEDNFVFCGDFNAPRGGEIYHALGLTVQDNLPRNILNTLDPFHHRKPELCYAVDNMFSKGNHQVSDVYTVSNISDHVALVGDVSLRPHPFDFLPGFSKNGHFSNGYHQ